MKSPMMKYLVTWLVTNVQGLYKLSNKSATHTLAMHMYMLLCRLLCLNIRNKMTEFATIDGIPTTRRKNTFTVISSVSLIDQFDTLVSEILKLLLTWRGGPNIFGPALHSKDDKCCCSTNQYTRSLILSVNNLPMVTFRLNIWGFLKCYLASNDAIIWSWFA